MSDLIRKAAEAVEVVEGNRLSYFGVHLTCTEIEEILRRELAPLIAERDRLRKWVEGSTHRDNCGVYDTSLTCPNGRGCTCGRTAALKQESDDGK